MRAAFRREKFGQQIKVFEVLALDLFRDSDSQVARRRIILGLRRVVFDNASCVVEDESQKVGIYVHGEQGVVDMDLDVSGLGVGFGSSGNGCDGADAYAYGWGVEDDGERGLGL